MTTQNVDTANGPLIGAHMPTAGGLYKAISAGKEIGCDSVQVFTASPRQWRHSALTEEAVDAYRAACAQCGIEKTVAHDSYLINLAAPEGEIRDKSRTAFRAELERAEALGIKYLVTHMGAHLGEGEAVGLARLSESINWLHDELPGYSVKVALETTAGQGTTLGAAFEQFPIIFNEVRDPDRLVICMDTCHIFVAGYDIRTAETYESTLCRLEANIGKDKLKVVHANDSLKGLGSKVDRHAHIGEGEIGEEAFRLLVNDPRFAGIPIVVETPDAETMHPVNVKRLRSLIHGS
jgi:deoxyribonuclease-4